MDAPVTLRPDTTHDPFCETAALLSVMSAPFDLDNQEHRVAVATALSVQLRQALSRLSSYERRSDKHAPTVDRFVRAQAAVAAILPPYVLQGDNADVATSALAQQHLTAASDMNEALRAFNYKRRANRIALDHLYDRPWTSYLKAFRRNTSDLFTRVPTLDSDARRCFNTNFQSSLTATVCQIYQIADTTDTAYAASTRTLSVFERYNHFG